MSSTTKATDFWIKKAIDDIYTNYGHVVSVEAKAKDLLKYGKTTQCQTTLTTIMDLPSGTFNETYVSSNLITTISSSSGSDTEVIRVEGHTIDAAGEFTFVAQNVTLTGQTQATLTTPLARCTRLANEGATDLVGNIYVYEDDTSTSGVPDTASGVHCMIAAGFNQSHKDSTTISKQDYWLITNIGVAMNEKAAGYADCHLEVREKGGVFRDVILIATSSGTTQDHDFLPYRIIKPNSDIRMRAHSDANNKEVSAHIQGVLLKIV
jgi:hypothetical protein